MMVKAADSDPDIQTAKSLLEEAAARYPGITTIFDRFGYRDLVYVLTTSDNTMLAKIGRTKHSLQQRVSSLQTGNPHRITPVIFTNKVTERYLHQAFKDFRVEGSEWFDFGLMQREDGEYRFPLDVIEDAINGT
jgi:hypothetical protein